MQNKIIKSMGALKLFVSGFVKRGGVLVFLSTFLGKFIAAFLSIAVVRIVSKTEYADITFVLSFFAIIVIFSGLGGSYSLLRYGAITKSISERKDYYRYTLNTGVKYAIYLALLSVTLALILPFFENKIKILLVLMSFALVTFYLFDVLKNYFRIINVNKMFAKLNVYFSIISFVLTVGLTYLFKTYGYIIALSLSPLFVFLLFRKSVNLKEKNHEIEKKNFWSYGLHTSVSAFANQIIFSIAPILIAFLSEDKDQIAIFKVATIIPFSVLMLPGLLMQSDFTVLARNFQSKNFLLDYYLNYLKIIFPLSIVGFFFSIYFGEEIIGFIFGAEYLKSVMMYKIFMGATFFTYLLRNPTGNILLAIGKAKWNGYNTYVFCVLYIVLSVVLFPIYDVYSLVYSLAFVFVFSGIISLSMFLYYLKTLK
jgi:O-antigen/teichoic acid export membrane protein